MRIKDKVNLDYEGLHKHGPINIVAFGDSVTHGSVATGENNYETVYWNRLKKKIIDFKDYVPVNVINAGIGGTTAKESVARIDTQVLNHNPDLVIVCFGLNDVNGTLEDYLSSLEIIFKKTTEKCDEVIFMTPNMLNTYVSDDTAKIYYEYAGVTAGFQNDGKMDLFMESACDLAKQMNVKVCDCYSIWKELSKTQDINMLLANRINHPTKGMHELFANELFKIIFDGDTVSNGTGDNSMYRGE